MNKKACGESSAKRGHDQLNECLNASSTTEEENKDERLPKDSPSKDMARLPNQYKEEIYSYKPKRLKLENITLPDGQCFRYDQLRYTLSEYELAKISPALGSEWKFVGYMLGLKNAEIDRCETDYPHKTILQIQEMFIRWKASSPSEATMYALLKVLKDHKGTVTWEIVSEVVNEYIQKHERTCEGINQ